MFFASHNWPSSLCVPIKAVTADISNFMERVNTSGDSLWSVLGGCWPLWSLKPTEEWQSGCNLYHCTCVHSVYTSPVSSGYQIEAPLSSQVRTAHSKSIQQVLYITKPHQEVSQGFIGMNHNKSDSFIEPLLSFYYCLKQQRQVDYREDLSSHLKCQTWCTGEAGEDIRTRCDQTQS